MDAVDPAGGARGRAAGLSFEGPRRDACGSYFRCCGSEHRHRTGIHLPPDPSACPSSYRSLHRLHDDAGGCSAAAPPDSPLFACTCQPFGFESADGSCLLPHDQFGSVDVPVLCRSRRYVRYAPYRYGYGGGRLDCGCDAVCADVVRNGLPALGNFAV